MTRQKNNSQNRRMGENICKQYDQHSLISSIYKQLIQLNNKKNKQPKQTFLQRRHTDANRYVKKCSPLLIIREMKIRTTMRYQFTPVRMAMIQKSTNNKCWRGCGEKGTLLYYWWECKLVQPVWKAVWRFLRKFKIELPYDPVSPLLGIYPDKTII